jgi:phosphoglycerate kinase
MSVSATAMLDWCRALLGQPASGSRLSLEEYLAGIPRLESLAGVPEGTPVLVRGDLDCKPGAAVGDGDERLRSMLATLEYGRQRGWKQVLFGHIGRKPEGSLKAVGKRLSDLLNAPVLLVDDWLDEESITIRDKAVAAIQGEPHGGFLLLENSRKYGLERVLWDAGPDDLPKLAEPLARLANEFAQRIARVYVNEAFSAGSLDASSTIVPAAMDRVALGRYVAGQFDGPMLQCRRTSLVVFSGLKIDKLDDLEAMIGRGTIRKVFTAGSLAMALKKADAELAGGTFALGVAEDPAHADKPYFIPRERIDQARRMLAEGRSKGIEFVLPCDFVLADGTVAQAIGPAGQQLDVGPKTSDLFARKVGEFIDAQRGAAGGPAVVFHNGVLGMFEDPRFEAGTRAFISQLKRMKDAGLAVYVGGGEGGAALEKYGQPDWVTHCFTAGGTVLNALGAQPVPYLLALHRATNRG